MHFKLPEDPALTESKRWVIIASPGTNACCLLLTKTVNEEQKSRIGNQTGGRLFLILYTDNFERDYKNLLKNAVMNTGEPVTEIYRKVAIFAELNGNLWDLIRRQK